MPPRTQEERLRDVELQLEKHRVRGGGGVGRPYSTYVIASSQSVAIGADQADYNCDGQNDEVEINLALAACAAAGGGRVLLLEGTFFIGSAIWVNGNSITLQGMGNDATIIRPMTTPAYTDNCMIRAYNSTGFEGRIYNFTLADLMLDGQFSTNFGIAQLIDDSFGTNTDYTYLGYAGIFMWWHVTRVDFISFDVAAIYSWNLYKSFISQCRFDCEIGIFTVDEFDYSVVSSNVFEFCTVGIHLTAGVYNVIANNVFECTSAIVVHDDLIYAANPGGTDSWPSAFGMTDVIISDNFIYADNGIRIHAAGFFTVEGNMFEYGSLSSSDYAISMYNCYNSHVNSNNIPTRYFNRGFIFDRCESMSVVGNMLLRTRYEGIKVDRSQEIILQANSLFFCGGGLEDTSPNPDTYSGATAQILLSESSRCTVTGNRVSHHNYGTVAQPYGTPNLAIELNSTSSDCVVVFNDCAGTYLSEPRILDQGTNNIVSFNVPFSISETDLTDHNHTSASGDGGVLTNDEHAGYSEYTAISMPSTPAAGKMLLYAKLVTGITRAFVLLDSGVEIEVGSGAPGGAIAAHYDFEPEFPNAIFVPGSVENGTLLPYDDTTARYNAYQWTTDQASDQTLDIVLRWRLSPRFNAWTGDFKMISQVTSPAGTNAVELVEFLDVAGANVITPASKKNASWTEDSFTITGGTWTPGGIVTLRFRLHAVTGQYAYLGPVQLAYDEV